MSAKISATETVVKIFSVWHKFNIQTADKANAIRRVLKAYNKYRKIQKKHSRSKQSATRWEAIKQYRQSLYQLFDVAHHDVCENTKNVHFRKSKSAIVPDEPTVPLMNRSSNYELWYGEASNDDENDVDFVHTEKRNAVKIMKTKKKR